MQKIQARLQFGQFAGCRVGTSGEAPMSHDFTIHPQSTICILECYVPGIEHFATIHNPECLQSGGGGRKKDIHISMLQGYPYRIGLH